MVNTFLPYPSFKESAQVLDRLRLNKQVLECDQILNALRKQREGFVGRIGWINHPATRMWKGQEYALTIYRDMMLREWLERGYKSKRAFYNCRERLDDLESTRPSWFGKEAFHASHRSNLLRKDPEHYGKFGWTEPDNLPYVWPA